MHINNARIKKLIQDLRVFFIIKIAQPNGCINFWKILYLQPDVFAALILMLMTMDVFYHLDEAVRQFKSGAEVKKLP